MLFWGKFNIQQIKISEKSITDTRLFVCIVLFNFHILFLQYFYLKIVLCTIPISAFTYKINEQIDSDKMKKIKASQITSWLMKNGYLDELKTEDGKLFKVLTDKSSSIGIIAEKKTSKCGRVYDVNLYNEVGQRFIVEHLDDIVKSEFVISDIMNTT